MNVKQSLIATVTGLGLAAASVPAAAGYDYTLGSPSPAGAPTLNSVTGYYSNNTTSSNFATAPLTLYVGDGYGENSDGTISPNHAVDNAGNTEGLLLSFSSAISLTKLTIGWLSGDSDISVFAYKPTGAQPATPGMTGYNFSTMFTNGWKLVGNYANLVADVATGINDGNAATGANGAESIYSSYWLISAYKSTGATATDTGLATAGLGEGNDYVKILSVYGNAPTPPGKVSEPSSMALLGMSLLGVIAMRRRQNRSAG